mgnify:CR=1 FL=1
MRRMRASTIATLGLLATLPGCGLGPGERYAGVFVYGLVTSEAGTGVAGAQLRISYTPNEECGAPFIQLVDAPSTDSTGHYGLTVWESGDPQTVCVRVVATPPADLGLAPDSLLLAGVPLTERMNADSVRIDLVLPPILPPSGLSTERRPAD